jgi:hypothetical protein
VFRQEESFSKKIPSAAVRPGMSRTATTTPASIYWFIAIGVLSCLFLQVVDDVVD